MARWQWDGAATAHIRKDDGTHEVKKFTSFAQARQFVEKQNNEVLAKRVRKHKPRRTQRTAARRSIKLNAQQEQLKQQALKQFIIPAHVLKDAQTGQEIQVPAKLINGQPAPKV